MRIRRLAHIGLGPCVATGREPRRQADPRRWLRRRERSDEVLMVPKGKGSESVVPRGATLLRMRLSSAFVHSFAIISITPGDSGSSSSSFSWSAPARQTALWLPAGVTDAAGETGEVGEIGEKGSISTSPQDTLLRLLVILISPSSSSSPSAKAPMRALRPELRDMARLMPERSVGYLVLAAPPHRASSFPPARCSSRASGSSPYPSTVAVSHADS
mmetsp:Transcript_39488/g.104382  ORF Transcript_39488/g.104382 Transcript_39488/m.104382 type:complete len:216 (+) Transcript_39488:153-800(+)